jgi:cation:H+ antiporter
MIGISLLCVLLFLDSKLGLIEGVIFLIVLLIYIITNVVIAKKEKDPSIDLEFNEGLKSKLGVSLSIVLIVLGLGVLILGSNLFVYGSIAIAKIFGVSDAVIGLTIVAIGTSLPELITSVVASYKNEADIAIGNVVGSNVFNILGILGITALITPIGAEGIGFIDFGIMIFAAIILLPLAKTGFSISRIEGFLLLAGYVVYIYYLLPK